MKKEFLIQSLLIFLSVFLGIMASNWNEGFKEQYKTKHFLNSLILEFQLNHQTLQKSLPYHRKIGNITDSLFRYMPKEDMYQSLVAKGGMGSYPGWGGLGISSLDNSVYQSGLTSGVFEHIPIDLLSKISRIQTYQEEYLRFSRTISDKLLSFDAETKFVDFVILTSILGNDFRNIESGLVKTYEDIIKEIQKEL